MSSRPTQFKVVLLGEGRVGKTSLVLRFCKGTFVDGQPPTIQASCLDKVLRIGDKSLHLVIWDTAGQERFHALGPIYYRDADAALLVYDITDSDSFNKVKTWVKELRKMVSPPSLGRLPSPQGGAASPQARQPPIGCRPRPMRCGPGGRRHRAHDRGEQGGP